MYTYSMYSTVSQCAQCFQDFEVHDGSIVCKALGISVAMIPLIDDRCPASETCWLPKNPAHDDTAWPGEEPLSLRVGLDVNPTCWVWPFRATCLIVNWAIDFKNAQMLKMGVVYYRYHSLSTLSLPLRSALSSFRSCPFLLCSLVRNPPGHWPMKTSVVQGTPGKLRLASLTAALNEQDMMTMDEEFQGSKCAGNVLCQLDANPHDSNLQNIANRVSPRIWSSFVNGA